MDYFLSVPNSTYFYWQLELLIQSFKDLNKEENLSIFIYSRPEDSTQYLNNMFSKNLIAHKKKIYTSNPGLVKGCPELNKLYNLLTAVNSGYIKQPFVLLEPCTVFRKDYFFPEPDASTFAFTVDPFFTVEEVEKNVGPFYEWFNLEKSVFESSWIPIGEVYAFNNLTSNFFSSCMIIAEKLALHQMLDNKKVWERTADLAIAICVLVKSSQVSCRGDCSIVGPINSDFDSFLVGYKDGYPPAFLRSMYPFNPLSFGDPIEELSKINYTNNSSYISNIARRIIARRS